MPDSQNPEHVRKLIAEFQLKGLNLIPTVTAEIVPTVLVADLTTLEKAADDRLCWGGVLSAASGVGNQGRLWVSNEPNSGMVMLVESIVVLNVTAADRVAMEPWRSAGGFAPGFEFYRDQRLTGLPAGRINRSVAVAGVLGTPAWFIPQNVSTTIPVGLAIPPNVAAVFTQLNQNQAIEMVVYWRERNLLPGE